MEPTVSIRGPLECVDGAFCLRIPLAAGGEALRPTVASLSRVEGDVLLISLPDWLMEKLGLREGGLVHVDHANGKFNIRPVGTEEEDGAAEGEA